MPTFTIEGTEFVWDGAWRVDVYPYPRPAYTGAVRSVVTFRLDDGRDDYTVPEVFSAAYEWYLSNPFALV